MSRREGSYARPRVIRGTQVKPLPLLPSGPGGVRSRPLHEARSLTTYHASRRVGRTRVVRSKSDRSLYAAHCHQQIRIRRMAVPNCEVERLFFRLRFERRFQIVLVPILEKLNGIGVFSEQT